MVVELAHITMTKTGGKNRFLRRHVEIYINIIAVEPFCNMRFVQLYLQFAAHEYGISINLILCEDT